MNKSVNTASFYYSLNMLKLLQEMHLISDDEADKIKKSLSNHYKRTAVRINRALIFQPVSEGVSIRSRYIGDIG